MARQGYLETSRPMGGHAPGAMQMGCVAQSLTRRTGGPPCDGTLADSYLRRVRFGNIPETPSRPTATSEPSAARIRTVRLCCSGPDRRAPPSRPIEAYSTPLPQLPCQDKVGYQQQASAIKPRFGDRLTLHQHSTQTIDANAHHLSTIAIFPMLGGLSTSLFPMPNSPNWPWVRRSSGSRDRGIAEVLGAALGLWFARPMGSPDGEENVRRGRCHRDLRPLVRRPLEA